MKKQERMKTFGSKGPVERKRSTKKLGMVMLALMLAAGMCLLSACGGSGSGDSKGSASAGDGSLKDVALLLDWTPNTNHTGIYAAKELGYYEEAGLNVDIQIPAEETATQLVGAGKGEFGIGNTEDTISAAALDDAMPVVSVAALIQHNTSGFVSLKESGIESPADWGGKTYGGYGGTTEEQIVRSIAKDNGVDPDSIHFVNLGNSDIMSSLQNGIDFAWVFEAAELLSLQQKGVECNYLPVKDYGEAFDYYTPVLVCNSNAAAKDPEMVKAFVEATAKGYQYAIDEPDKAADILLKAAPELDENLVREGQKYLSERYAKDAPQWGWQEESVWQSYEDFLFKNGLIEKDVDVKTVFTNEYLPKQ